MKRILAAFLSMAIFFGSYFIPTGVVSGEADEIPVVSYVLMEAETGTVLLESEKETRVPLGTMAKLMTAYLVGQKLLTGAWNTETVLSADKAVEEATGAVIWLVPGEEMTVSDLLKGLLVGNANDAALALAVACAGSVSGFVEEMNRCAKALGMEHTHFTSPQGDNSENQYTTAYDLGLLCCALTENTLLTPYFQIWRDFLRGTATELVNENTLVRTDETAIGFKACHGETDGWSVAAGANRNQMNLVAIVLGCETEEGRFTLAKSLLRQGFSGWKLIQPGLSQEFLYPVAVRGGVENFCLIQPQAQSCVVVPKSCTALETVLILPEYVCAPVEEGQRLGTIACYVGDTLLLECDVVAAESVKRRRFSESFLQIVVKMMKI